MADTSRFKILFKKYRLKAEISTLLEFGNILSEKGLIYEDSIFSHWQKGTRVPQRSVLLRILEIFIERKAVTSLEEANEFLSSAGEGYLSEQELGKIPLKLKSLIFQVPSEIINFNGRIEIIRRLIYKEDLIGKIVIIHGVAGVGKTALAIKLGHLLKDKFKDGVLWYKIEKDNIMDIFFSIAHIFGEDISNISDKQVRATVVRSLLASKNVLLFLDSAEVSEDIHLLIPNSKLCTTIITTQKNILKAPINYIDISLKPFTEKETIILFKEILKEKYKKSNIKSILGLAEKVEYLPLALHILARELFHSKTPVSQLQNLFVQEKPVFQKIYYKDKNLYTTIALSYNKLDSSLKSILASAAIFTGKDFSAKSLGYINGLSIAATTAVLQSLIDLSLVEHSTKNRYRLHPAIREFIRDRLDYPKSSNLILIAFLIFIFFTTWWVYLQMFVDKSNIQYQIFSGTYGLMALYGGLSGIHISQKWGGLKSLLGKAIFMFSCGLFAQEFGQVVYSYYMSIKHTKLPYPSIGDIGFFATVPFYIYGVWLLAGSAGIKINIQSFQKKIVALIVPITMLTIAYFIFLQNYLFDWSNPFKIFLDFGYPFGDALYISIAIIIFIFSRNILDGIMRSKALLILVALFVQFIADYIFVYKSDSFYPGDYMDFLFLVAYFIMTLALLNLKSLQVKIKNI